jgi:chorismate-pyruvate lyase
MSCRYVHTFVLGNVLIIDTCIIYVYALPYYDTLLYYVVLYCSNICIVSAVSSKPFSELNQIQNLFENTVVTNSPLAKTLQALYVFTPIQCWETQLCDILSKYVVL